MDTGEAPQTYCQVCGRPLSDPDSVAAGIGPICASKQGRVWVLVPGSHDNLGDIYLEDPPLTQALVLQRMDHGVVATNVPHKLVHHSPSGFEYGYGGSGPADLALNLAEFVVNGVMPKANAQAVKLWDGSTCTYAAWIIHHDLKFGLLSGLKMDQDHRIPYGFILEKVKFLLRQYASSIQAEERR